MQVSRAAGDTVTLRVFFGGRDVAEDGFIGARLILLDGEAEVSSASTSPA
ncbi:MAG: hypothetical protein GYB68_20185 [Chloroflexi bacterium]|nr:hypothetical protein [Chloroflexota bacterium]